MRAYHAIRTPALDLPRLLPLLPAAVLNVFGTIQNKNSVGVRVYVYSDIYDGDGYKVGYEIFLEDLKMNLLFVKILLKFSYASLI